MGQLTYANGVAIGREAVVHTGALGGADLSFNHACPDVPAPVIADSAVLLGPVWIGAGAVLAQGAVVR